MSQPTSKFYIVDDDESVRASLCRLLHSAGLKSRSFASGELFKTFLEHDLDAHDDACGDCAIVDVHLPGMNGIELMKYLHKTRPKLRVVLITASVDPQHLASASEESVIMLHKPFDDDALFAAITSTPTAAG